MTHPCIEVSRVEVSICECMRYVPRQKFSSMQKTLLKQHYGVLDKIDLIGAATKNGSANGCQD